MDALKQRIEDIKDELCFSTEKVEYKQGAIQAIRDILDFKVEGDDAS